MEISTILQVVLMSLLSIVVLFVLTKIMGARQISEMSMFDYINGITIGSIAAEMAISTNDGWGKKVIAMVVYGVVAVLLSYLGDKSVFLRRIISGKPYILLENGVIYEKNLKKVRININEFLAQCRISGFYDIGQIYVAIFEENGKISFLPKSTDRYLTPSDVNMTPNQDVICYTLVIDGEIQKEELGYIEKDEKWLNKTIKQSGANNIEDILLAVYSQENGIRIFKKEK